MSYVEQKAWIKSHKRDFVNDLIKSSNVGEDDIQSAIFMASLPGAGKTEFTKNLIRNSELKAVRLDMDKIAEHIEGYRPEIADMYRESATTLLSEAFNTAIKRRVNFIMDGTFGSKYAIDNIVRTTKRGYKVKIFYLYQDPKIAWKFTLAREKIEHRSISMDGFIDTYFHTIDNIKKLISKNLDNVVVDIIIKNDQNVINEQHGNVSIEEFDKIIKNNYTKETLKEYIKL